MSRGKSVGYRLRNGQPTGASRVRDTLSALGVATLEQLVAETGVPQGTVWAALRAGVCGKRRLGSICQPWRGVYATPEAADLLARVIAGLRTGHAADVRAALDTAMREEALAAE